ncbi:MFS transporter [Actinophytocola sp.]|uniref:MFS transporter n=1 Tax=Actinophytocola sp. TaxID=1872138 RepID=UPI00389A34EF
MFTTAARRWGLLVVLAGTMLIDALEVSAMVVALPAVADRLGLPLTTAVWLVSGFAAGFGGLVLFGAQLVAWLGRRRVYLGALALFAVACVLGAATTDPTVLIATRFVRGVCAALTAPTGLAIIMTAFTDTRDRGCALSVYTLMGASGFATGLVLSGLLTTVDWRWAVVFPAPAALLLFVLGLRFVPGDGGRLFGRPDAAGAACLAGALLALVAGILRVPAHAWDAFAAVALVPVLLGAFVLAERSSEWPLVRGHVLTSPPLVRAMLGAAALNGSYLGLLVICTVQWQAAGWSPLTVALAMLPASVPLAVAAPFAGRMLSRFGTDHLIAFGALAPPAGYALYLWRGGPASYVTGVLPTMLLVGIGFVLCFTALNAQATAGLPAADRPVASGIYQTAVQTAAAVLTALVAALSAATNGYRPALWLVTAVGVLGALAGAPAIAHTSNVLGRRLTH